MGALFAAQHPDKFSRLLLIEGGGGEWDIPTATKYRGGGGERVLFVCGIATCKAQAERGLLWLRRAGLTTRHEFVRSGGHTYGGKVEVRLRKILPWFLQGLPRFAGTDSEPG